MSAPHSSESLGPVVLCLVVLVVGPALVNTPLGATLTATPLRQAVSGALLLALLSGLSVWVVPGVSIRAAIASEGGSD